MFNIIRIYFTYIKKVKYYLKILFPSTRDPIENGYNNGNENSPPEIFLDD